MSQRILEIVDYSPSWVEAFELEKSILEATLKTVVVKIHHIGSTSIPGLAAKPIIDILMEAKDLSELDRRAHEMESLGYRPKGENGIVGRRYFQKGGNQRSHHLHAYQCGDVNLIRHIAFRDYLLHHREIVTAYEKLKLKLASGCENDLVQYQNGKSNFLQEHEELALKWYRNQNPQV